MIKVHLTGDSDLLADDEPLHLNLDVVPRVGEVLMLEDLVENEDGKTVLRMRFFTVTCVTHCVTLRSIDHPDCASQGRVRASEVQITLELRHG